MSQNDPNRDYMGLHYYKYSPEGRGRVVPLTQEEINELNAGIERAQQEQREKVAEQVKMDPE